MKNITKNILLLTTILVLIYNNSKAQGCSDAGLCTVSNFKPTTTDSLKSYKSELVIGSFWGKADHSIKSYGSLIEFSHQLSNQMGFNIKISSITQSGNGLKKFGLSDLFLNANYKTSASSKLTIGVKIPFSSANKMVDGYALPMDYQSSLGTIDVLAGFAFRANLFQFVIAAQQPITQNNNHFLAVNTPNAQLRSFQSTNKFQRSGDLLFRASYPLAVNARFTVTPSILPIYHLKNDSYTDEMNLKKEINGSKGLTLNSNLYLDYKMDGKSAVQLSLAMPLVVRDARPDGLTRKLVANFQYSIKF
ncbi:hypothetical protein ACQKCH_08365 [Nubsella zeaxanthinifaciens]|uniref:hypothetical protein n=1 Tax=Nubsella zeaxanthinifaciens TaxID=392412 RepID=UPI003CFD2188